MGLPLAHGSNVVPSGLLLSSLTRLTGSLTAGIWARFSARQLLLLLLLLLLSTKMI